MYRSKEIYQEAFYQSNIFRFYFEDLNIGVIDIETTGLSPDRSHFILGGLVLPDTVGKKAIQIFAESKEEEPDLLHSYLRELRDLDVLISYNGDHFDIPFLNKRIRHNRISNEELPFLQSFDLYRMLERHSNFRKLLPNLKQKTVEAFLGLWSDRSDEISGAESVELYYQFLETKDLATRDTILLHNKDDILQLSRLLKVFEKLDLHRIMFHMGFIVSHMDKKIFVQKIEFQKDALIVSGTHKNVPIDYRCYHTSHEVILCVDPRSLNLKIPFKKLHGYSCIDLEELPYDCSELEKHPRFQSGYLLLKGNDEINYAETNHLVKLILKEIIKSL